MVNKLRAWFSLLDGHKTTILVVTATAYCGARMLNGQADVQECVKVLGPLYGIGVVNSRIGRYLRGLTEVMAKLRGLGLQK